jgi:hypothetical protein
MCRGGTPQGGGATTPAPAAARSGAISIVAGGATECKGTCEAWSPLVLVKARPALEGRRIQDSRRAGSGFPASRGAIGLLVRIAEAHILMVREREPIDPDSAFVPRAGRSGAAATGGAAAPRR